MVIELSELQLPTLSRGTTVAVYTNVTSDHLDRHGTLQAYRAVKRRLAELVDPAGALVLNDDDPVVAGYAGLGPARPVRYRLDRPAAGWPRAGRRMDRRRWRRASRAGRRGTGRDRARWADPAGRRAPRSRAATTSRNALAATAVALLFGIPPAAIRAAATAFQGVEHRLETVALVDGVRFVNDSQGTQPDAVIAALRAFDPPIVLIAGGRDKGVDLAGLGPVAAERVAAAVLIGESGPELERRFRAAGLARTERAATLEAAVRRAAAIAAELRDAAPAGAPNPPTVLLSPAAASFDMFVDYEARGRAFKAAVASLAEDAAR